MRTSSPVDAGFLQPLLYPPFRVDLWNASGGIDREIGLVTDVVLARALFEATVAAYPGREVTLRQVTRVLASSRPSLDSGGDLWEHA